MLEREIAIGVRGKDLEIENQGSLGLAVALIGIDPSRNGENLSDPYLWIVLENNTKVETEKIAGQQSLPGESKKIGENVINNLVGAIAEITDSDFVIRNNLFVMPESYAKGAISIRGNPVDLMSMVYQGPLSISFQPVDKKEVTGYKWRTLNELGAQIKESPEKVRKFTRDVVVMESSARKIGRVAGEFIHSPLTRLPFSVLLPQSFCSIRQFYQERERGRDARIFDRSPNQK